MDLDDRPIGRVLTRREALTLLGSTGTLVLLGCSPSSASDRAMRSSSCVVRPAMTAGPYYVDEGLDRSDIRSDPTDGTIKTGAPLALTLRVYSLSKEGCLPLKGALVDVWHCDAEGVYSDAVDPKYFNTTGKKFLRGYQRSDGNGVVSFTTIYPGWYPQRTPHIHYKLRLPRASGQVHEFTSQLYFDEGLSDRVYAKPPYATRGKRTVSNLSDRIYNQSGGRQSMLAVIPARDGYTATFDVAMDLT
jgi:protocatechuate 3,4-dioxygenase beta subunit